MASSMRTDGSEPLRPEAVARVARPRRRHTQAREGRMATATLACPGCDAPVALPPGRHGPTAALACPVCDRPGPLRDFLSLAAPARPARVAVRVVRRDRAAAR